MVFKCITGYVLHICFFQNNEIVCKTNLFPQQIYAWYLEILVTSCIFLYIFVEEGQQQLRKIHLWKTCWIHDACSTFEEFEEESGFKDNSISMDETSIWNDMVSSTTVKQAGAKDVPLKTTGHKKV